jgi:hypothetical protein
MSPALLGRKVWEAFFVGISPLLSTCPNLMVFNHPFGFQKGPQKVKMGHQEIAGVLWELGVLCCAFWVDLQRTSRERGC